MADKNKFEKAIEYLKNTPGVEIYDDLVNLPQKGAKKLVKKIAKTKSVKAVGARRKKIKANPNKKVPKAKAIAIDAGLGAAAGGAKVTGLTVSGASFLLLWLGAKGLSNPLPKKVGKALKNKQVKVKEEKGKVKNPILKAPNLSAYAMYYMMMAGVLFGANVGDVRDTTFEKVKDKIENLKDSFTSKKKEKIKNQENENILSEKKTGAEWCSMDFMNALCVAIPLVFEECYTTAKLTSEQGGVYNIGYCMLTMPKDKNNPYGAWRTVKAGDTCTQEQAALWAAIYNQKNVFPTITEKLKVKVSCGMILALTDLSYNSGSLGIMIARLNDGWTEQQVLDKMLEYRNATYKDKKGNKVVKTLDGLINRCWWRYAAGSNVIDYNKLLDCRLTAVSQVGSDNLYSDKRKYKPIITDKKVEQVLTVKVPNRATVREIFNKSETGKGYIAAIENLDVHKSEKKIDIKDIEQESEVYVVNNIAFEAQTAFDKGDYKTASEKFRKMIELVPDAYDSYNDLIYTLYKIGKYDEALKYARILIDLGHANDVTEDKMFGSAYFNAGLCREAKGELDTARKCYVTASKRMPDNQVVKDALTRIDKKIKEQNDKKKKTSGSSTGTSNKKKNTKPATQTKFNKGSSKVKGKTAHVVPEKGSTFDATFMFLDTEGRA